MPAFLDVIDGGFADLGELRQLSHPEAAGLPSLEETFAELLAFELLNHTGAVTRASARSLKLLQLLGFPSNCCVRFAKQGAHL